MNGYAIYFLIGWIVTNVMAVLAANRTGKGLECVVAFAMMLPVWPCAVIAWFAFGLHRRQASSAEEAQ